MKVSVITVSFNALQDLRKTVASVVSQSGIDFEYIIVDGASTDGTSDYLSNEAVGVNIWISEPDSGIYNAMNKAVRLASGDYCIFMNAGDCFIDRHVLKKVSGYLDGSDIVLGNQVHVSEKGNIDAFIPSFGGFTLKNLLQSTISHQSAFIRRSLLLQYPYDEELRLVSDWKFFLERFLEKGFTGKTVNVDVCLFRGGGATDKNRALGASERRNVLSAYPQYSYIWQAPYNPSVFKKAVNKLLYYAKKIKYSSLVARLNG